MQDMVRKITRETTINKKKYTIKPLGAMDGLRHGRSLLAVVAPLLGGTMDGLRVSEYVETPKSFTELALTLCQQLDKLDVDNLVISLLDGATCNSVEITDIDEQFRGEMGAFIELVGFALQENFGELFTGKGLFARLQKTYLNLLDGGGDESLES